MSTTSDCFSSYTFESFTVTTLSLSGRAQSSISEGLPISILEAALCGLCVVCTNVGGCSELLAAPSSGEKDAPASFGRLVVCCAAPHQVIYLFKCLFICSLADQLIGWLICYSTLCQVSENLESCLPCHTPVIRVLHDSARAINQVNLYSFHAACFQGLIRQRMLNFVSCASL